MRNSQNIGNKPLLKPINIYAPIWEANYTTYFLESLGVVQNGYYLLLADEHNNSEFKDEMEKDLISLEKKKKEIYAKCGKVFSNPNLEIGA